METTRHNDGIEARNRIVCQAVSRAFDGLGGEPIETALDKCQRRAAPLRRAMSERSLTLLRDYQGLLRWEIGDTLTTSPGQRALLNAEARLRSLRLQGTEATESDGRKLANAAARRRSLRRAPLAVTPVLTQSFFDRIEPSKIGEWLKLADRNLTRPAWNGRGELWGLRRLTKAGTFLPFALDELPKLAGRKVLLIVHGTFSNNDALLAEMLSAPEGPAMISAAVAKYDDVLCFDHPTLGQSPMLNAFDLASRLALGVPASLDLLAHSRGGLVVRWFCEGFRHPDLRCRAILVGSPLAGTSLAAPARARAVMDFLANVGDAVSSTVSVLGGGIILSLASTLAGLFARVAGTLSTPLADAIVALVPGLAAQSREGGNAELRALRINTGTFNFSDPASPVRYAVIRSNFEPIEEGAWEFIKSFVTRPGTSFLDVATNFIFEDANDLVVNTASMDETGELAGPPATRAVIATVAHDFCTSRSVHHCNYFRQRETIRAIRTTFAF